MIYVFIYDENLVLDQTIYVPFSEISHELFIYLNEDKNLQYTLRQYHKDNPSVDDLLADYIEEDYITLAYFKIDPSGYRYEFYDDIYQDRIVVHVEQEHITEISNKEYKKNQKLMKSKFEGGFNQGDFAPNDINTASIIMHTYYYN